MRIDLLTVATLRSPDRPARPTKYIPFKLKPGSPARRFAFDFRKPIAVSKNAYLGFTFHSPSSSLLYPDILNGDIGYPEIRLINQQGTIYRFKRGNLKDFFNFRTPNEPQTLALPLAAFVFDVDIKVNVRTDAFFDSPLKQIFFDFLPHPVEDIDIELKDAHLFHVEQSERFDIQDVLTIKAVGNDSLLPTFLSETDRISLALTRAPSARELFSVPLRLNWEMTDPRGGRCDGAVTMSPSQTYLPFDLPFFGGYQLKLEAATDDRVVAEGSILITRALPRQSNAATKLGISDGDKFDRIARVGGGFDRTVLSLHSIVRDGASFRFAGHSHNLPATRPDSGRSRIIALKQMPRWLSARPNAADYFRYWTDNTALYAELMQWLARQIQEAGGWGIEVWNEASVIHEWNDSMDALIELHRVSYEAIKSVSEELVVLGGSTHTWDFSFLERFVSQGGGKYCDALAVHGYTYTPERHAEYFSTLHQILTAASKQKGQSVNACITEVGFRWPAFSVVDQAVYLTLFSLEVAVSDQLNSILWFRYENPRPEGTTRYDQTRSGGYAFIGYQERYCRPSIAAFRFLERCLQEHNPVGAESAYDGSRLFSFTNRKTWKRLIVSFCRQGMHAAARNRLPSSSGRDLFGNPYFPDGEGRQLLFLFDD